MNGQRQNMDFGLTERALDELVQGEQRRLNVLKLNATNYIERVLEKDYERRLNERCKYLTELEKQRMQKTKEYVILKGQCKEMHRRRKSKPTEKLLEPEPELEAAVIEKEPEEGDWMDTQKPGFLPPPCVTGSVPIEPEPESMIQEEPEEGDGTATQKVNISPASSAKDSAVNEPHELDKCAESTLVEDELDKTNGSEIDNTEQNEACFHLLLGVIRNPTPTTRKFMKTESCFSLYDLSSQLVGTDSQPDNESNPNEKPDENPN